MKKRILSLVLSIPFLGVTACDSGFVQPKSCAPNGGGFLPDTMIMINAEKKWVKNMTDDQLRQCFDDCLRAMRQQLAQQKK